MQPQDLADVGARIEAGETVSGRDLPDIGGRFGDESLGLVIDTIAAERIEAHLEPDERHHQPFGIVHGGVWASVVESVASIAATVRAAAAGRLAVGVANQTDFLRPHRTGRVEAVGEPIHLGRTQQLWQVTITRQDGRKIARGQVRLQVVEPTQLGG